jgi:hypothetical protein
VKKLLERNFSFKERSDETHQVALFLSLDTLVHFSSSKVNSVCH